MLSYVLLYAFCAAAVSWHCGEWLVRRWFENQILPQLDWARVWHSVPCTHSASYALQHIAATIRLRCYLLQFASLCHGWLTAVRYQDIILDGVYLPLQILDYYCPWPCNTPDGNTAVRFSRISFKRIRGSGRHTTQGIFKSPFCLTHQDFAIA